MPLTPKQEWFCREYVTDCNATAAAIRAKYTKGCSGRRLLLIPEIQARIKELQEPIYRETELTAQWIIDRLMEEASNANRPGTRVRALGLLAKIRGLLIDRQIIEQKPLYSESAYDDLMQTQTVDTLPVCPDRQPGPVSDAAPHNLPRNGLVELPQVNGADPLVDRITGPPR